MKSCTYLACNCSLTPYPCLPTLLKSKVSQVSPLEGALDWGTIKLLPYTDLTPSELQKVMYKQSTSHSLILRLQIWSSHDFIEMYIFWVTLSTALLIIASPTFSSMRVLAPFFSWHVEINVIFSLKSVLNIHESSVRSSGKAIDCIVITWAGCNPTHQTIQPTTSPWQSPNLTHHTFTSC